MPNYQEQQASYRTGTRYLPQVTILDTQPVTALKKSSECFRVDGYKIPVCKLTGLSSMKAYVECCIPKIVFCYEGYLRLPVISHLVLDSFARHRSSQSLNSTKWGVAGCDIKKSEFYVLNLQIKRASPDSDNWSALKSPRTTKRLSRSAIDVTRIETSPFFLLTKIFPSLTKVTEGIQSLAAELVHVFLCEDYICLWAETYLYSKDRM